MESRIFPRQERLKKSNDIAVVFKTGRSVSCSGVKLFYKSNKLPYNRIACTFSRKFGNAVQRNRARRLGREAYRHLRTEIKGAYDFVLLVYPAGKDSCFSQRLKELNLLLEKAQILEKKIVE